MHETPRPDMPDQSLNAAFACLFRSKLVSLGKRRCQRLKQDRNSRIVRAFAHSGGTLWNRWTVHHVEQDGTAKVVKYAEPVQEPP
jgi:hypothetical protein